MNSETGKMSSETTKIQEVVKEAISKEPTFEQCIIRFTDSPTHNMHGVRENEMIVGIVENKRSRVTYQYHIYVYAQKYEYSISELLEETLREKFSEESGEVRVTVGVFGKNNIVGTITKL